MADIKQAVQFGLHLEDSKLSGEVTTLPGDRGGATRFGLASHFHPDLVEREFYELIDGEPLIPSDEALDIAEEVYEKEYASKLMLDQIESQDVANRLFGFAINEGPREAVTILQRCLNALTVTVTVDGIIGPKTVAAINSVAEDDLINAQRIAQANFYRHLVAVRPEMLPNLHGLLNRAAV